MKAFEIIAKILAAVAVIAGIVYLVATYGDKIVAWAKKLLPCKECEIVEETEETEPEETTEEAAETVDVVEEATEAPAEEAPVAEENDFAE